MGKTPKLRFPEFTGEWEEKKFEEIFDVYSTNSYSRNCLNNTKGTIKNIHYGDIHMNFPTILDAKRINIPYINNDVNLGKISKECYCKEGDIIIADASEDYADIGKTIEVKNVENQKIIAGLHTILARDNKEITVNGYRGYMFLSNNVRKQIKILAVGAKVLGISKSNINKIFINIPSLQEQEKIATFFSVLDKKIEKQQEKVELLKQYKKGMMQKIFNREIRFKDENGEDYLEWKDIQLGKILDEKIEKSTQNNQYEIISSTTNGLFFQKDYFNREIASNDNTGYKILRKHQIVLSPQNLWMGNINFNDKFDIGIVSPSYKLFEINSKFDSQYIGYILKTTRAFYEYIQASEQGASVVRRNLNIDLFQQIVFNIPCKEEQQKIANFLSTLDKKIEKEQEKLNKLNELKKGLLQQMFV